MGVLLTYAAVHQPIFLVQIDGEDAPDIVSRIGKVKINESHKKGLVVDISLSGLNPPGPNFQESIVEDPRVQDGARWSVRWGYFDDISPLTALEVTSFKPNFKDDGTLEIMVRLSTKGARLRRTSQARNWAGLTSSEIVEKIANRHGLTPEVKQTNDARRGRGHMQPANVNDMEFIQRLARRNRFVAYVDGNTLYFEPRDLDSPPRLELAWYAGDPRSRLKNFQPEIKDVPKRRSRSQSANDDDNSQSGNTNEDGGDENTGGAIIAIDSRRNEIQEVAITDPAASSPSADTDDDEHRRTSVARQRNSLERANQGKGRALGTPQLRKNVNISLVGIGTRLSGTWHIHECTHTLEPKGTYSVDFVAKRGAHNATPRPDSKTINGRPNDKDVDPGDGRPNGVVAINGRSVRIESAPNPDQR